VCSFEIDRRLLPMLTETLSTYTNVEIINQDILEADLAAVVEAHLAGYERMSVVANLPYYITTPIILLFLEARLGFRHLVFMLQKEVADRIAAQPGTKVYGSLSIAVQYYAFSQVEKIVLRSVVIP